MRAIFGDFIGGRAAFGLLVLRVVVGFAFVLHGMGKIQDPMHWMDKMHMDIPPFLQALAALAEFGGGIALILGLLTPLAALGIACNMLVAIFKVHLPMGQPFIGMKGSWEPAGFYLAAMILLLLAGPGQFSLDAQLFERRGK